MHIHKVAYSYNEDYKKPNPIKVSLACLITNGNVAKYQQYPIDYVFLAKL